MRPAVFALAAGLVATLAAAARTAPIPKGTADAITKEYGTIVDPGKDCTFTLADGKLVVTAPGAPHTLTSSPTPKNAPRVVRDVTGDFTAVVRFVVGLPRNPTSEIEGVDPGASAGLVVWADDKNYLVAGRFHDQFANGQKMSSNDLHTLTGGIEGGGSGPPKEYDANPVFVRVSRVGKKVTAAVSADGKDWKTIATADFPAAKVKVGPVLEHTTGQQVTATFDQFSVK